MTKTLAILLSAALITPCFAADKRAPKRPTFETCVAFKDDNKGHAKQVIVNDKTCETGLRWRNAK